MISGRIFVYVHVTHNWIACHDVMTSSNLLSDDVWTNSIIHMTPQVRSCHSVPKTSWSKTTSVYIRFRPLPQAMVERQWIITNRTTLTIGVCRQRWLVHPTNNHTFGSSTDTTTHRNERCDLCASDLRCVGCCCCVNPLNLDRVPTGSPLTLTSLVGSPESPTFSSGTTSHGRTM